jgi:hypothetical protein
MKIDGVNKETGEVVKPYETPEHLDIKKIIQEQIDYVNSTIRDKNGEKIARLDGDTLSMVLMELTAMYESLSRWLADEKLHIADLKTALELKFADTYCDIKKINSETNETARMKAKIICGDDQKELDRHKHGWDVIEAWKKSIGRYHDAVRSQLSYEKSLGHMSR